MWSWPNMIPEGLVVQHKITKEKFLVLDNWVFHFNFNKVKVRYWNSKKNKYKTRLMDQRELELSK